MPQSDISHSVATMDADAISVKTFFAGKVVFVTGATGFLGKSIVEKLLTSCDVRKIFVLIREKRGKSVTERIRDFRNDQLFKFRTDAKKLELLIPIAGDISVSGLGLSPEDRLTLASESQVVIHSAATVKFDEPLHVAMQQNVLGTLSILNLCKETPNLQLLVCVGTAFSRSYSKRFEEQVPPDLMDPLRLISLMEEQDQKTFNCQTFDEIRNGHPNTYTLTKNVSENLVNDFSTAHAIRTVIAKPGIILPPIKEPHPFYVEGVSQGSASVGASMGAGIPRVFTGRLQNTFPGIPVDMCANALLVACADAADRFRSESNNNAAVRVYGLYDTSNNSARNEHAFHTVSRASKKYPTMKAVRPPADVIFSDRPVICKFYAWLFELVFAFFFDLTLTMSGQPAKMTRIMHKFHKTMDVLSFFVSQDWQITGCNTRRAFDRLCGEEKAVFDCDTSHIDWEDYFQNFWLGIRKWVFREEMDNLAEARSRLSRLKLTYYSACTLLLVVTGLLLFSLLKWCALSYYWLTASSRLMHHNL